MGHRTSRYLDRTISGSPAADRSRTARGGAWSGPTFVFTHHPKHPTPAPPVTFLDCSITDVVRIALEAAAGKSRPDHAD